jgi:hypothetical protein
MMFTVLDGSSIAVTRLDMPMTKRSWTALDVQTTPDDKMFEDDTELMDWSPIVPPDKHVATKSSTAFDTQITFEDEMYEAAFVVCWPQELDTRSRYERVFLKKAVTKNIFQEVDGDEH